MHHKSDTYSAWVTFTTELFTQYSIKVKLLQSDNDTVFTSAEFTRYLQAQGTIPRLTVHDTPKQNGVAERTHQTLINHIHVNLHSARLADRFWNYAVQYAAYCLNLSPRAALNFQTPYYMCHKTHYNLDNMHPFGALCIVYDEAQTNKLRPHGIKVIWLCFVDKVKGHVVWLGTRVSTEQNVQFLNSTSQIEEERPLQNPHNPEIPDNQTSDTPMDVDQEEETSTTLRKSTREHTTTRKACGLDYDEVETHLAFYLTEFNAYYLENVGDPVTFKDVLNHPLKDQWFDSMRKELAVLEQ